MKGRKPTPTAVHKLRGSFNATRHGRDRASEPAAAGDLTAAAAAPEWMTAEQQAGWQYAVEHAPAGLLKQIDAGVLAVWVIAEDQHRIAVRMQAQIDRGTKMPLMVKDKNDLPTPSPYLIIINRAALRMLKAASDLGFSPAARPRISAGAPSLPEEYESPWDQFEVIRGGKGA